MARRRKGRAVDGVVLLDKAYGVSSNHALQAVRRRLNAAKAGHTGSLDPLATGLLPICLGEATKLSGYLLSADKRYRVTAALGGETTTGDAEGEITAQGDDCPPSDDALAATIAAFTGAQTQVPPMYSALKVAGKPLYAYAREGKSLAREPRAIVVHRIERVPSEPGQLVLEIAVSGGTYIRTLIEDMARHWGGRAHVAALRRLAVGTLGDRHSMVDQDTIDRDTAGGDSVATAWPWLLPVSELLAGWPTIALDAEEARRIGHGQTIARDALSLGQEIRLDGPDGQVLGLGQPSATGQLAPLRLFAHPVG